MESGSTVRNEEVVMEMVDVNKTFTIWDRKSITVRNFLRLMFTQNRHRKIHSLKNIALNVYDGEILGVIGRNGSGKSTLLKIMSGVYEPDAGGEVEVKGRVIRLALGIGFDQNVSARDNIYINGSLLGLSFKEIGLLFDQIIEYAELQEYVDTKVKYFSTGMRSRLAFAIAVNANADIFLIDELFGGVGDIRFKEKSDELFKSAFLEGRTIVFVSHNLHLIQQFSDRVLVLEGGEIKGIGKPQEMVELYKSIAFKEGKKAKP